MDVRTPSLRPQLDDDDWRALDELAEGVFTGLAVVFVGLLALELVVPLSSAWADWVRLASYLIWAAFALEFGTRLILAADRLQYLRSNWLAAIAVVLPAFRVLRVTRVLRAARVARLVTGTNRGTRALRRIVGFGGVGYVVAFSVIVVLTAGPGIASLESDQPGAEITTIPDGLWWAATTLATLGSQEHPVSAEGRVLGLLVMVVGLAISGYVTAVLAVFLLGLRERTGPPEDIAALREDIQSLRRELADSRTSREAPPTS